MFVLNKIVYLQAEILLSMESLYFIFYQKLRDVKLHFKRYLFHQIIWADRLICILGERGVGKSTMILQFIKSTFGNSPRNVLYVSLDHVWFSIHSLYELGEQFVLQGGDYLFLDEVHKYRNWSQEIKNLYDSFPQLKIVFTGSSILEIEKGNADLSRRVTVYTMKGMSFREFLEFDKGIIQEPVSLQDVLNNHEEIALKITEDTHILPYFSIYLKYGYFPYYKENKQDYYNRLERTLRVVLEEDLPAVEKIDYYSIDRIKQLLVIISTMVPFTPNISELSGKIGVSRNSLLAYLRYLSKAGIIHLLQSDQSALRQLTKPEKIYLGNPNYCYALSFDRIPDVGNLRETFFMTQLSVCKVRYTSETDFLINGKYYFEVGGRNKGSDQIVGLDNAFLALDDIEIGIGNRIPLWLFGFLY